MAKVYKCPVCGGKKTYLNKKSLYNHIEEKHPDVISEDVSPARYYFNAKYKKEHGNCVICGKPTKWIEEVERYNRFCCDKCKQAYVKDFKKKMMDKYGKEHLLNDPRVQQEMLNHRSISGQYKFTDGKTVPYVGSYEEDFLRYCDKVLSMKSTDVMQCPHTFFYMYNGKKLFYIPDYYLPNLGENGVIVEIKDGRLDDPNRNKHHKIEEVDRVKEHLKDEVMQQQKKFVYIKIYGKDYEEFMKLYEKLKES